MRGAVGRFRDYECDWEECEISYVRNAERYYGPNSDIVAPAVKTALGRWDLSEAIVGFVRRVAGSDRVRRDSVPLRP